MKKFIWSVLFIFTISCNQSGESMSEKTKLETDKEKLSYAIGADVAKSVGSMGAEIDVASFTQGFKTALMKKELLLNEEETKKVIENFRKEQMMKRMAEQKAAGTENQKKGEEFLAKNKDKAGVKVTASGLQYEVMTEGSGVKPKATDKVKVHYKGTLLDGTEFDSSYSRGTPASFPLNGVIKGWTEGLQLMTPGSKYKFYIPSELAYGSRGAGGKIGPNSTLIFEVELLEINPK